MWLLSRAALRVVALGFIVAALYVGFRRLEYPYELEWLETGVLEHVRRVAEGLPLYTPPSVDFTQYPYPPVFLYLAGALGAATQMDYWTLRLVSILATIAIFVLIVRIVTRECKQRWAGFVAAGMYAASYGYTGGFFDVGKTDSLFLAFSLWGVDRTRTAETKKQMFFAGLVFVVAIYTKQTALFVAAPVAVYLLATRWRLGLVFSATVGLVTAAITGLMTAVTHGWFFFYVWELLLQHGEATGVKLDFFRVDLLPFWPALIAVVLCVSIFAREERRWASGYLAVVVFGLGVGSFLSRLHDGGFVNVLMPIVAGIAIALGIATGVLVRREHWKRGAAVVVLCVLQFVFLRYDIGAQLPTAVDRRAGDAFIASVRTFPGPVLISAHPTYAVLAGKPAFASQGGVIDIMRGTDTRAQNLLRDSYAEAIHERRFSALMLDSYFDKQTFPADWQSYYCRTETSIFPPSDVFRAVTSKTSHPQELYLPCGQ